MNVTIRGVVELPIRFNQKRQTGYCTFRDNGNFYMLRFGQELYRPIELAALQKQEITVIGTGHTFKHIDCGKHHFYIKAASID